MGGASFSIAAMRNKRDKIRRQAVANDAKANDQSATTSNLALTAQLKLLRAELTQFKKEQKKEHEEMSSQIKHLEHVSLQVSGLRDRLDQQQKNMPENPRLQLDELSLELKRVENKIEATLGNHVELKNDIESMKKWKNNQSNLSTKTVLERFDQVEISTKNANTQQEKNSNQQRKLIDKQEKLIERLAKVEQNCKENNTATQSSAEFEKTIVQQTKKLEKDLGDLQTLAKNLLDQASRNKLGQAQDQDDIDTVQTMMRELKDQSQQNKDGLELIDESLTNVEKLVHEHGNAIEGLGTNIIPALFTQQIEPLKQYYEQQLTSISEQLEMHKYEITKLKLQQSLKSENSSRQPATEMDSPQVMSIFKDMKSLQQEMSELKASLSAETARQDRDVKDVKGQLTTKEDTFAVDRKLDSVRQGLNSLEDRYQNITTDQLYQKMVHWFVQAYPSNANMAQQLATIKMQVAQLNTFLPHMVWVQSHEQDLAVLTAMIQQLQALCSEDSPFARIQSIQSLEEELQKLQEKVVAGFTKANNAQLEFRTTAGIASDQRVKAEAKIRSSVEELKKFFSERLKDTEVTITDLRHKFDDLVNDCIEPNKELFTNNFPLTMTSAIGELQAVVSQRLSIGPLPVEWSFDVCDQGKNSGKGKARSKP